MFDAVVVTYNSAQTLKKCLESLALQAVSKIIVVDNGSSDSSRTIAEGSPVLYVQRLDNAGFATAANQGAELSTSPYLLFLNPDAYLAQDSLSDIETYFEQHPDTAVIGVQLVDEHNQPEKDNYGYEVTPWSLFTRHMYHPAQVVQPAEVDWVSGGALFIRTDIFKKINGFDPSYFLYWEDVDLCRRVREQYHQKVVFFPTVQVRHTRGASLSNQASKTQFYDASADRYFQKHYAAMIWISLRIARRLYRWWQPQVR